MRRIIIYFIGILITAAVVIVFICIYFTANISETIPPIRKYGYKGSAHQLIDKIDSLAQNNSKIIFKVDEILGNKSRGYSYAISITIKDSSKNLLYDLMCSSIHEVKFKTKLQLIGAHNLINHTGGYGIKSDGINELLREFNSNIIVPLQEEGVNLEPL